MIKDRRQLALDLAQALRWNASQGSLEDAYVAYWARQLRETYTDEELISLAESLGIQTD